MFYIAGISEKASWRDLDGLMSISKHPSPSDTVFPHHRFLDRGGKVLLPYSVCAFPSTFLSLECGCSGIFFFFFCPYPCSYSWGSRLVNHKLVKRAGKHWLELPRFYVTVVHSQSIIYTKYKIQFPLHFSWCLLRINFLCLDKKGILSPYEEDSEAFKEKLIFSLQF